MHELSIAEAIVAIVCDNADERRVTQVDVRVGHLRQVVPGALRFSFELVAQGTLAEGAELVLESVRAQGDCRTCGARSHLAQFPLSCRACGGLDIEIVSGEELCVESLDVTEEPRVQDDAT